MIKEVAGGAGGGDTEKESQETSAKAPVVAQDSVSVSSGDSIPPGQPHSARFNSEPSVDPSFSEVISLLEPGEDEISAADDMLEDTPSKARAAVEGEWDADAAHTTRATRPTDRWIAPNGRAAACRIDRSPTAR